MDFEKLGVFYLGKEYNLEEKKLQEDLVLYKSKDLTTHGVIIGMTGSGKTGLGIGIIEEAAIDNIPVIAIDPKGDLANLALTFPQLRAEDFRPWINLHDASAKEMTADEYAQNQAQLWRKGLADWDQDGARIERLRQAAEVTVYTPGGAAGRSVSVLKSFDPPSRALMKDADAYRDRVQIMATGLLSLLGLNADPFTSREHILISNILEHFWSSGNSLSLADLIKAIQKPPLDKVGIMDLESFYPAKDRVALAMSFNNLLASPSFKAWLEGDPLDTHSFLYSKSGRPKISVFSIAHLGDAERMFFVTMLLNDILSWTRSQAGTGSLRALLYMDELFGYLPPTANPPSKMPLLTLLKQARAFGLGLLLATQNPVDLDYKALSNAGTWFIGRLQTERDKERVLAGLEGVASSEKFSKQRIKRILTDLGQRVFYLHNVHEDQPLVFNTRWVLSYLAGPLTREQIAALPQNIPGPGRAAAASLAATAPSGNGAPHRATQAAAVPSLPTVPPQVRQVFLPACGAVAPQPVYSPSVLGVVEILYTNARYGVNETKNFTLSTPLHEGPVALEWGQSEILDVDWRELETEPLPRASYNELPGAAVNPRNYDNWQKLLSQYARRELTLKLYRSPILKAFSQTDEDEVDFRIRLRHLAHEERDAAIEKLQKKYSTRLKTLEDRRRRARQKVESQSSKASQQKMDAAITAGTALLGALLGKKALTRTTVNRMGTAVKSTSRAAQSSESIAQAEENLQAAQVQLQELQMQIEEEVEAISDRYDIENEDLEEIIIRATATNIVVHFIGLAWSLQ